MGGEVFKCHPQNANQDCVICPVTHLTSSTLLLFLVLQHHKSEDWNHPTLRLTPISLPSVTAHDLPLLPVIPPPVACWGALSSPGLHRYCQ